MSNLSEPQVLGSAIQTLLAVIPRDLTNLLGKYGIPADVDPNGWYSQQDYADLMNEVAERTFITDLVSVGMEIARQAVLPSNIDSVEAALERLFPAYQGSHRNIPDDEGWTFDKIDEDIYFVIARTPYPSNFAYGVVYGFVQRFSPKGTQYTVYLEEANGYPAYRVVMN